MTHPEGAYYVMADISDFGFENDVDFTKHLIREIGVAVVPGSSFYHDPKLARKWSDSAFAKRTKRFMLRPKISKNWPQVSGLPAVRAGNQIVPE